MDHKFGGPWTEIKLEILAKYLSFFTSALKNRHFQLIYIDAFAGSGECYIKTDSGDKRVDGSAAVALQADPPFNKLVFIEENTEFCSMLEQLISEYPDRNCNVFAGDANKHVVDVCEQTDWRQWRGVLFLDPYGMNVEWDALKSIAATKALDLWYLFPISGLYRLAAHKLDRVDAGKAESLTRILGTNDWAGHFYRKPQIGDLFDDNPSKERALNVDEMERYVQTRLRSLFPRVVEPKRLPTRGAPLYSLFFCVSNPSEKAIALSTEVANHILKSV